MRTKFFRTIVVFVVIILSTQITFSQESDSKNSTINQIGKEKKNSLEHGMWAIQFGISNNFTLTNFDGATFSIKYHFSPNLSLRAGFTGKYYEVSKEYLDFNYISEQEELIGGNLILMYYLNPGDRFNIYGYIGGQYTYHYTFNPNGYQLIDNELQTYGPLLGTGAEYFVFKKMSLFAEYSFNFNFGKNTNFSHYVIGSSNVTNIVSFDYDNVKFGLSVYFDF